ncbi:MAG: hypothetical protein EZS28_023794 [Streblomastix strix]|uniref:Uncharacterized protein n=1 Tax=Streblomastix strix TaxID=222440 RepID=A0A5J4VDP1_9EUKA|nr:MAG: hypothetical protein EZS28_023794 [Streblomastix strix]
MGFFSKVANFGSKFLGGVKHAAQWIAPTLHKVFSTVAGPVGMIHPGIGGALGAGANLAGAVDRLFMRLIIKSLMAKLQISRQKQPLMLINEVNQLQSTVESIDADIVGVKNDIITIQQELAKQQHFRGYYLLNSDITSLPDSADGDFAFCAESGTVWMYDTAWCNSGQVVPDQVSPASDAVPLVDNATGAAGNSTEYSRGDHQHPLQVPDALPQADTATGEVGTAATYARSDHTHHVNLSNDVPLKDSGTGTAGASNIYASATHQHPLNVDPTVANVPLVNATAAANGSSDYQSRNDHVHPQQLTYDGNITATKFIKTGGLITQILIADGTNKSITDFSTSVAPRAYQIDPADGLRISRSRAGCGLYLGTGQQINGTVQNQWQTVSQPSNFEQNPLGLTIGLSSESGSANRGLRISADGNELSFNGSVIAGTGATNGASSGLVNYSAGNPILWGVNSVDTNGEFYSDGAKVYWRIKLITVGPIPP